MTAVQYKSSDFEKSWVEEWNPLTYSGASILKVQTAKNIRPHFSWDAPKYYPNTSWLHLEIAEYRLDPCGIKHWHKQGKKKKHLYI